MGDIPEPVYASSPTEEDLEIQKAYEEDLERKQNGSPKRPANLDPVWMAKFDDLAKLHPGKSITFVSNLVERALQSHPALIFAPKLAEPLPDVPYLVRDLAMVGGGTAPDLIAGFGFSGKTLAMQSLILSLASERGVWGPYSPTRGASCIHVDLEQGFRLTTRRYQRLALGLGIDLSSLGPRLAVVDAPNTLAMGRDEWLWLMEGRQFMLVDSLRALTPKLEENSSSMREPLDFLGSMSNETGCHVAVIHHATKPSLDRDREARFSIRGSGAIYDAADAAWVFSAAKGEPVKVEHAKARSHGALLDDFALTIADVAVDRDPKAGLLVSASGVEVIHEQREAKREKEEAQKGARLAEMVLRVIAATPGLSTNDLQAACGLSGSSWALARRFVTPLVTIITTGQRLNWFPKQ